jgi:hypothetical protein
MVDGKSRQGYIDRHSQGTETTTKEQQAMRMYKGTKSVGIEPSLHDELSRICRVEDMTIKRAADEAIKTWIFDYTHHSNTKKQGAKMRKWTKLGDYISDEAYAVKLPNGEILDLDDDRIADDYRKTLPDGVTLECMTDGVYLVEG